MMCSRSLIVFVTFLMPGFAGAVTIDDISFNWSTHRREAPGSDNWPVTWADDGHLYTVWGDGGGFGGTNNNGRVSLGFGRIEGPVAGYSVHNVWGGTDAEHEPQFGGKSYAILSLGGTLYAWIANPDAGINQYGAPEDFRTLRLYRSTNKGRSWSDTGQEVKQENYGGALWNANLLNFGRDYAGARDAHVYTYWVGEKDHGFSSADTAYLTRVSGQDIESLDAYEFFAGLGADGAAVWSGDASDRAAVFERDGGIHWTFNVVYIAPLQTYLLMTNLVENTPQDLDSRTDLAFYQADEPWGPWTHVKTFSDWRPRGATDDDRYTFFWDIPAKWVSAGGTEFTFVYTGKGVHDSWNTVRGTFSLSGSTESPCHLIGPGVALPAGFAAPYSVVSETHELLMTVDCTESDATLTVGSGSHYEFVYRTAYLYRNNQWQQIPLQGSNLQGGAWYVGTAQAQLPHTQAELSQNNFVVAYLCTWTGQATGWKCGCRDQACTQPMWQLQAFRR